MGRPDFLEVAIRWSTGMLFLLLVVPLYAINVAASAVEGLTDGAMDGCEQAWRALNERLYRRRASRAEAPTGESGDG